MDLGFNLAQSNRDLKDLTSRQNFGDTSGLLCKNDLIPCHNTCCDKRVNRFFLERKKHILGHPSGHPSSHVDLLLIKIKIAICVQLVEKTAALFDDQLDVPYVES